MGQLLGALIITFLLTRLGLRLTRNLQPGRRLLVSHVSVWLLSGTLYGFGAADGGPFTPSGYVIYAIPVLFWAAVDGFRLGKEAAAPRE